MPRYDELLQLRDRCRRQTQDFLDRGGQGLLLNLDKASLPHWDRAKRVRRTQRETAPAISKTDQVRGHLTQREISTRRRLHAEADLGAKPAVPPPPLPAPPLAVTADGQGRASKAKTLASFLSGIEQSLSPGQIQFLRKVAANKHIFVTGGAGVGKSFVVQLARDYLAAKGAEVCVSAFTGPAATIVNGSTLHSWMGIGVTLPTARTLAAQLCKPKNAFTTRVQRWKNTKVLVIDEISMVPAPMFQLLVDTLTLVRSRVHKNKGQSALDAQDTCASDRILTGSMRLIVCGDFFQLPPVVKPDELQRMQSQHRRRFDASTPSGLSWLHVDLSSDEHANLSDAEAQQRAIRKPYAFTSKAWRRMFHPNNHNCVQLKQMFRQRGESDDADLFRVALNELRIGKLSADSLALFESRRVSEERARSDEFAGVVHLYTHLQQIGNVNQRKLRQLTTPPVHFRASVSYDLDGRSQKSDEQILALKQRAIRNTGVPSSNELRVGARVMLRINSHVESGLVNGSVGTIVGFATTDAAKSAARAAELLRRDGASSDGASLDDLFERYGCALCAADEDSDSDREHVDERDSHTLPLPLHEAPTASKVGSRKRKAPTSSASSSASSGASGASVAAEQEEERQEDRQRARREAARRAAASSRQPFVLVRFDRVKSPRATEPRSLLVPVETHAFHDELAGTTVLQVPLVLAWATTVHKSQGASLDAAVVDVSRAFEFGQVYVALSRVKSLAGLHLVGWDPKQIRVDDTVLRYYSTLPFAFH